MDLTNMSLREKIGQTVITLCVPDEHIQKCGSIEAFLEKYPIGGLYNSGNLIRGMLSDDIPEYQDILALYNKYSKIPLFSTADMESGTEQKGCILFPKQMALAASNDEKLAYQYGRAIGSEASACGINWMFAPDSDLNLSPLDPVTNTRALSDNPDLNIKLLKQIIKGIEDSGVIATVKHFPGNWYTDVDTHLAPVSNRMPMEEWWKLNGYMYQSLIEYGVSTFMSGHQNLESYQTEKVNHKYSPATMSYEIITNLLRGELGFQGVVVTDALVMGGFAGTNGIEKQIESFKAGNDIMLWPSLEYIDEMEKKILCGEISEKQLDEAVERILTLKNKSGILTNQIKKVSYDEKQAYATLKELSENCLTLVENYDNLLPVDKSKIQKVIVVGVTPFDEDYERLCGLKTEFEKFGILVDMKRDIWQDELFQLSDEYDLIIFALSRQIHRPVGPMDFWGENATSIWTSNCSDGKKTIIVSFGSPYSYKYYKESDVTYVNAYAPVQTIFEAFVKALFGEIGFRGVSPVQL